jgi:hypothetical protein
MSRRTNVEMECLRSAIYLLAEVHHPCTVRQIYYLGIGRYWAKDIGGNRKHYRDVVRLVGDLREQGELPWGWIADNTRWVRKDTMFSSKEEAVTRWAEAYRRDLWASQRAHVEVWCESDSIAGVINDVTRPLGVGLYVCRGQSSKTYVYEAAQAYRTIGKEVRILYVGDWDPTGLAIPLSVEERIHRYADIEVMLDRVAVTTHDVANGDLVAHEVNTRDGNYQRFAARCIAMGLDPQTAVEVEAIPPANLRSRLNTALYDLVDDAGSWNATIAAEESEQDILRRLATGDTSAWSVTT